MDHIRTPKVDNVKLVDRLWDKRSVVGQLFITATHLIFMDPDCRREKWILHSHISNVEKLPLTASGCPIKITCKTFHIVTFVIPRERICMDVIHAINKLSQPDNMEELYAFSYKDPLSVDKSLGWSQFDPELEYQRMGLGQHDCQWVKTTVNDQYALCDTYPRNLYIPKCAKTPHILGSSKFRSRGRLPVLSYLHRNNAALCRCSQPLAGFSARCMEDEQLLQCILQANAGSKELCVVDTRPMINAVANAAAGKGYEKESNYNNIRFQFVGIENIHVMRTSLQKLVEVSDIRSSTMNSYLTALESSGWLKHIKSVLDTSLFIVDNIEEGTSVLVHCSDGWDRTAQTCSLAAMMLDPHYRTIQGFISLIEKEWLSFGHKFTDRCRLISVVDSKEESPVFTQFLDATWQMMNQFPAAFQFNERFLLTLHDHVYSSQFGTFLGNCEKDRVDLRLSERTYSLWGYITSNITDFINPLYKRDYESDKAVLKPHCSPQFFKYWKGMYNRYDTSIHEKESVPDIISALVDHNTSLKDHIYLLEKRVQELAKLLGRPTEAIAQKFQGLLSAESIHCLNSLLEKPSVTSTDSQDVSLLSATRHMTVNDLDPIKSAGALLEDNEDRESGFEEGSNFTKSTITESGSVIRFTEGLDNLTLDHIKEEMGSVAINLTSLRNKTQCSCSVPFEHNSKRYHCWKCGNVFCSKCIEKHTPLAGHYSQKPVPVCKNCYKTIKTSKSVISLQQYADQHVLSEDLSPQSDD